jgi:hypothetical protein
MLNAAPPFRSEPKKPADFRGLLRDSRFSHATATTWLAPVSVWTGCAGPSHPRRYWCHRGILLPALGFGHGGHPDNAPILNWLPCVRRRGDRFRATPLDGPRVHGDRRWDALARHVLWLVATQEIRKFGDKLLQKPGGAERPPSSGNRNQKRPVHRRQPPNGARLIDIAPFAPPGPCGIKPATRVVLQLVLSRRFGRIVPLAVSIGTIGALN